MRKRTLVERRSARIICIAMFTVIFMIFSGSINAEADATKTRRADTFVDENGFGHMVWQEFIDGQFDIYYGNNITGNLGYGHPDNEGLRITESGENSVWASIDFDYEHHIFYVSWIEELITGDFFYYSAAAWDDDGLDFIAPKEIGPVPTLPGKPDFDLVLDDGMLLLERKGVVHVTYLPDTDDDLISDQEDPNPLIYDVIPGETIQADVLTIDTALNVSVAIDYSPVSTNPAPSITPVIPGFGAYWDVQPLPGFTGTYIDIVSSEKNLIDELSVKLTYGILPAGVNEEDLVIYVWDSVGKRWVIEENTGVDSANNYVWVLKSSLEGDIMVMTDDEDADGLNNGQETYEDDNGAPLAYWFEAEDHRDSNTELKNDKIANDPDGDGNSAIFRPSSGEMLNATLSPQSGYYKFYLEARTTTTTTIHSLRMYVTGSGSGFPDVTYEVRNLIKYEMYSTSSFYVSGSITLHAEVSNTPWHGIQIDKFSLVKFRDMPVNTTDDADGLVGISVPGPWWSGSTSVDVLLPLFRQELDGYASKATIEISSVDPVFINQSVIANAAFDCGKSIYLQNGHQWVAQKFQSPIHDIALSSIELYLRKGLWGPNGTFADFEVEIQEDTSGAPSGSYITNGRTTEPTSSILYSNKTWINISFATAPVLTASTDYWIVLKSSNTVNGIYEVGVTNSDEYKDPTYNASYSNDNGTSWAPIRYYITTMVDLSFRMHSVPLLNPSFSFEGFPAWSYSGDFSGTYSIEFSGPINDCFYGPGQKPGWNYDQYGNVIAKLYFSSWTTGMISFSNVLIEFAPTVSDPRDPDTDLDGLSDADELWTGVFDGDSDNDLMLDGYEMRGGGQGLQYPLGYNERYALNLIIVFNWNVGSTYLDRYKACVRMASNYLLDATDGYMLIGAVSFYDTTSGTPPGIDISVGAGDASTGMSSDPFWPQSYVGGIAKEPKTQFGIYFGIKMPETFLHHFPNETFAEFYRPYYTTLTHEILHYAGFVYDEYQDKDRNTHPNPPNTIMNNEWTSSEMSTRYDYNPNEPQGHSNNTYQFYKRGESCWETFFRYWNSNGAMYHRGINFDLDGDGITDQPVDNNNDGIFDVLEHYSAVPGPIEDVGDLMDIYSYV